MATESYKLINLSAITWPNLPRPNVSTREESAQLGPLDIKTSEGQQRSLELLLEEFRKAMISVNLQDQWFLHAGALLGSLQHHDFLPWDEDADLHLHIRHRRTVQAALKNLSPRFVTYAQRERDKLYFRPFEKNDSINSTSIGSQKFSNRPWAWPFIDISYFKEMALNLCQDHMVPHRRFKLSDVFPTTYRPLGMYWLPGPRRPVSYLKFYYKSSKQICKSHYWSHITEHPTKSVAENCRLLMEKYPFVHRCPVPQWEAVEHSSALCDEYLVDGGGQVVHKIRTLLDEDECEAPLYTVRHESFKCP
ncbi:hypothetical protein Aperf_G00000054546 [Anoplocephala perfoliata]